MEVNFFIKFGKLEDLKIMQNDGVIFCNTISYFANLEDEKRGDKLEAVSELNYFENAILEFRDEDKTATEWKRIKITNGQHQKNYKNPLGNIFCMTAFKIPITTEIQDLEFDSRFLDFGGHGLIIERQDIFFKRLKETLQETQYDYCTKFINYLDLTSYSGKKTLFQKDLKYKWQQEFRLVVQTEKYDLIDPLKLRIGNIKDISSIIDLSKTKKLYIKKP